MFLLYNLALHIYHGMIVLAAVTGNEKARLWLSGRKNWRKKLIEFRSHYKGEVIWFHCSSLGEFEQGRPVLERIRTEHPSKKIVLTFFSPSGYEVRKNFPGADLVMYLPLDTDKNARAFISLLQPNIVFFIKYEYWYHFLSALHRAAIPVFFVSSNFRDNHVFFKWYGGFFRKMLTFPTLLLVQNERSLHLLSAANILNAVVTGDTRFDRVAEISSQKTVSPKMEDFQKDHFIIIGGSTWPEDEDLLLSVFITLPSSSRLIIAPHDISRKHLSDIIKKAEKTIGSENVCLYSKTKSDARIVIIDSVGMLSSLYRYAHVAWIGGGFGAGIHNTLEAAAYGIPVLFGPKHQKFDEAAELIKCGGGYMAENEKKASDLICRFERDVECRTIAGNAAKEYISKNKGATNRIMEAIQPYL